METRCSRIFFLCTRSLPIAHYLKPFQENSAVLIHDIAPPIRSTQVLALWKSNYPLRSISSPATVDSSVADKLPADIQVTETQEPDSRVSGRALEDSIRISTKFPELMLIFILQNVGHRYDVITDVAPELKWIPEDGYKNLKIVVDIDKEIDAATEVEQELRRLKALGALRIVTDRGLELGDVAVLDISATSIEQDESTP